MCTNTAFLFYALQEWSQREGVHVAPESNKKISEARTVQWLSLKYSWISTLCAMWDPTVYHVTGAVYRYYESRRRKFKDSAEGREERVKTNESKSKKRRSQKKVNYLYQHFITHISCTFKGHWFWKIMKRRGGASLIYLTWPMRVTRSMITDQLSRHTNQLGDQLVSYSNKCLDIDYMFCYC